MFVLNRFHFAVVTGWGVMIAAVIGGRLALGVPTTVAEGVTVLLLACVPLMLVLAVFGGAARRRLTPVLRETDRADELARRRVGANPTARTGSSRRSR